MIRTQQTHTHKILHRSLNSRRNLEEKYLRKVLEKMYKYSSIKCQWAFKSKH